MPKGLHKGSVACTPRVHGHGLQSVRYLLRMRPSWPQLSKTHPQAESRAARASAVTTTDPVGRITDSTKNGMIRSMNLKALPLRASVSTKPPPPNPIHNRPYFITACCNKHGRSCLGRVSEPSDAIGLTKFPNCVRARFGPKVCGKRSSGGASASHSSSLTPSKQSHRPRSHKQAAPQGRLGFLGFPRVETFRNSCTFAPSGMLWR